MNARDDFAPGLVRDMPHADYLMARGMSASALKDLQISPAHYFGRWVDRRRPTKKSTPVQKNGTLVHCVTFEPDAVASRYVVKPEGLDGRTKEGKAWVAENADREIVDSDQMEAAKAQAAALRALPDIASLLSDGYAEASVFWTDEDTGRNCKARPDWVAHRGDGVILVDGKTCQDASPDGFGRQVWNYAYHLQAAHYIAGFESATGLPVLGFIFAAVESTWPHAAAAYMLGDDVLDAARRERRRLLDLYAECRRTNTWPAYGAGVQIVNLPKWANVEETQ